MSRDEATALRDPRARGAGATRGAGGSGGRREATPWAARLSLAHVETRLASEAAGGLGDRRWGSSRQLACSRRTGASRQPRRRGAARPGPPMHGLPAASAAPAGRAGRSAGTPPAPGAAGAAPPPAVWQAAGLLPAAAASARRLLRTATCPQAAPTATLPRAPRHADPVPVPQGERPAAAGRAPSGASREGL